MHKPLRPPAPAKRALAVTLACIGEGTDGRAYCGAGCGALLDRRPGRVVPCIFDSDGRVNGLRQICDACAQKVCPVALRNAADRPAVSASQVSVADLLHRGNDSRPEDHGVTRTLVRIYDPAQMLTTMTIQQHSAGEMGSPMP